MDRGRALPLHEERHLLNAAVRGSLPMVHHQNHQPILISFVHSGSDFENDYFVDDPRWAHLPASPELDRSPPPPGLERMGTLPPSPELVTGEEHRRRQKDNPWVWN